MLHQEKLHSPQRFFPPPTAHCANGFYSTFTLRSFYTEEGLHIDFIYTEERLHKERVHTVAIRKTSVNTQHFLHCQHTVKSLHTQGCTKKNIYAHTKAITHNSVYTQQFLHRSRFTHRIFIQKGVHTQKRLHRRAFTQRDSLTQKHVYIQDLLH